MSRSKKKSPVYSWVIADSEKQDKRKANRALRRAVKLAIKGDRLHMPLLREVSNVYDFNKDASKHWAGWKDTEWNPNGKLFRK